MIEVNQIFGHVKLAEIIEFEKSHNFTFPDRYRNFLIENNGGIPEKRILKLGKSTAGYEIEYFLPLKHSEYGKSLSGHLATVKGRISKDYIPIAFCGGDYLCISIVSGKIYYWSHENEEEGNLDKAMLFVSDNFEEMLNSLSSEIVFDDIRTLEIAVGYLIVAENNPGMKEHIIQTFDPYSKIEMLRHRGVDVSNTYLKTPIAISKVGLPMLEYGFAYQSLDVIRLAITYLGGTGLLCADNLVNDKT